MFSRYDPLLVALLKRLPPPGSHWPEADRKRWLGLLCGALEMIYPDAPSNVVMHRRSDGNPF